MEAFRAQHIRKSPTGGTKEMLMPYKMAISPSLLRYPTLFTPYRAKSGPIPSRETKNLEEQVEGIGRRETC
ncbi:hypothetical protein Taro_052632 [Colocasia esculenta]|uniref:Uncharacterized protein n=1 Tax=Colocasia esculenta TaxID=4460 RepID=A0A843XJW9_COLES|nr:hypothetical protein [Colocasia esculenta]